MTAEEAEIQRRIAVARYPLEQERDRLAAKVKRMQDGDWSDWKQGDEMIAKLTADLNQARADSEERYRAFVEMRDSRDEAERRALAAEKEREVLREENVNIIDCSMGEILDLDGRRNACDNPGSVVEPKGCLTHLNQQLAEAREALEWWTGLTSEQALASIPDKSVGVCECRHPETKHTKAGCYIESRTPNGKWACCSCKKFVSTRAALGRVR